MFRGPHRPGHLPGMPGCISRARKSPQAMSLSLQVPEAKRKAGSLCSRSQLSGLVVVKRIRTSAQGAGCLQGQAPSRHGQFSPATSAARWRQRPRVSGFLGQRGDPRQLCGEGGQRAPSSVHTSF